MARGRSTFLLLAALVLLAIASQVSAQPANTGTNKSVPASAARTGSPGSAPAGPAPTQAPTPSASTPPFVPLPFRPGRSYSRGQIAVCEDNKPWVAKYWTNGTTCVPSATLTPLQLAEWPWSPAEASDLAAASSAWAEQATRTLWTGTGSFTETNTAYIETPEPTYVVSGDAGYGAVPAAGTYMKNGWMCFEWGNVDGYTFPIRVVNGTPGQPSGGVPACMATPDRSSCQWVSPWFGPLGIPAWISQYGDYSRCQALVDAATPDTPHIACGGDYMALYKWSGYDETDPESWCAAASLALDIRPDALRKHIDSEPVKWTFENAAGRPPNFPTKEMRPAPRPEDELLTECIQWGWGCASCDELRYQCTDGIAPSCAVLDKIPASCPGNGVRDPALEWYMDRVGPYPQSRYTQTSGRPKATARPTPAASTTTAVAASGTPIVVDNGTTRLPGGLASKISATQTATPAPVPGSANGLAASAAGLAAAGLAVAALF